MNLEKIVENAKSRSIYKSVRLKVSVALVAGCFLGAEAMYRYLDPEGVRTCISLKSQYFQFSARPNDYQIPMHSNCPSFPFFKLIFFFVFFAPLPGTDSCGAQAEKRTREIDGRKTKTSAGQLPSRQFIVGLINNQIVNMLRVFPKPLPQRILEFPPNRIITAYNS
jgi:hypothetical protein